MEDELSTNLRISSPVFNHNEKIPDKYTCKGQNVNPPLEFSNIPDGTRSLVLIVTDPDSKYGTFIHWSIYNMNPQTKGIRESILPPEARQGKNGFGENKYAGPCPEDGRHNYFFSLYALDTIVDFPEGATIEDLQTEMDGSILDQTSIVGWYEKY